MLDKKRLGTFILGGLTGVLAGILLAPKSGREVRGDIANRAGEAGQRSRESYFDTEERLKERLSATRDRNRKPQPSATREMPLGTSPERPPETSDVVRDISEGRANLRDVSQESGNDARSEELRKKVRETRERIRSRMESEGVSGEGIGPDGKE